jgi:hypothetical protein
MFNGYNLKSVEKQNEVFKFLVVLLYSNIFLLNFDCYSLFMIVLIDSFTYKN